MANPSTSSFQARIARLAASSQGSSPGLSTARAFQYAAISCIKKSEENNRESTKNSSGKKDNASNKSTNSDEKQGQESDTSWKQFKLIGSWQ